MNLLNSLSKKIFAIFRSDFPDSFWIVFRKVSVVFRKGSVESVNVANRREAEGCGCEMRGLIGSVGGVVEELVFWRRAIPLPLLLGTPFIYI